MKQPKFNFFQKLVSKKGTVFQPTSIFFDSTFDYFMYSAQGFVAFKEDELEPYVEPKPKVKKWLYVYESEGHHWTTIKFFKDDNDFKSHYITIEKFKKLEWSMIEVEE